MAGGGGLRVLVVSTCNCCCYAVVVGSEKHLHTKEAQKRNNSCIRGLMLNNKPVNLGPYDDDDDCTRERRSTGQSASKPASSPHKDVPGLFVGEVPIAFCGDNEIHCNPICMVTLGVCYELSAFYWARKLLCGPGNYALHWSAGLARECIPRPVRSIVQGINRSLGFLSSLPRGSRTPNGRGDFCFTLVITN